jgi:hypothetical protein
VRQHGARGAGGEVARPSAVLHAVTAAVKPKVPSGSSSSPWTVSRQAPASVAEALKRVHGPPRHGRTR